MDALVVGVNFIGTILILIISLLIAKNIGYKLAINGKDVVALFAGFIIFILIGFIGIYIFANIISKIY
tara:strand:- start:442 stop:645 length:204 start_codon:yes stop_codon:yes gene_type:complete